MFQLFFYNPSTTVLTRFIPFVISFLAIILLLNYFGQRIIDKKEEVFHAAYFNTKWYLMPVEHRRMVLMILINSSDCSGLSAGKMGDVSLEAAGIVIFNQNNIAILIENLPFILE